MYIGRSSLTFIHRFLLLWLDIPIMWILSSFLFQITGVINPKNAFSLFPPQSVKAFVANPENVTLEQHSSAPNRAVPISRFTETVLHTRPGEKLVGTNGLLPMCFSGLQLGRLGGQKECSRDTAPQLGRGVYQRGAGVPVPAQSPCLSLGQPLGALMHLQDTTHLPAEMLPEILEAVRPRWRAALEPFLRQCWSSPACSSLQHPCVPALCAMCSHAGVLISSSALRGSDSQLQQKRSTLRLMNSPAVVVEAQRIAKVTYAQW